MRSRKRDAIEPKENMNFCTGIDVTESQALAPDGLINVMEEVLT